MLFTYLSEHVNTTQVFIRFGFNYLSFNQILMFLADQNFFQSNLFYSCELFIYSEHMSFSFFFSTFSEPNLAIVNSKLLYSHFTWYAREMRTLRCSDSFPSTLSRKAMKRMLPFSSDLIFFLPVCITSTRVFDTRSNHCFSFFHEIILFYSCFGNLNKIL